MFTVPVIDDTPLVLYVVPSSGPGGEGVSVCDCASAAFPPDNGGWLDGTPVRALEPGDRLIAAGELDACGTAPGAGEEGGSGAIYVSGFAFLTAPELSDPFCEPLDSSSPSSESAASACGGSCQKRIITARGTINSAIFDASDAMKFAGCDE